jgi:hypothetical protein
MSGRCRRADGRMVGPALVGATPRASTVPGRGRNARRPVRAPGTIPAPLTCTYRERLGYRPGPVRTRGNSVGSRGRRPAVRGVAHASQGAHGPQLRAAGPAPQHEHLDAAPLLRGRHGAARLRTRRALRRAVRSDGGGAAGAPPPLAVGDGGTPAGAGRRAGGGRYGARRPACRGTGPVARDRGVCRRHRRIGRGHRAGPGGGGGHPRRGAGACRDTRIRRVLRSRWSVRVSRFVRSRRSRHISRSGRSRRRVRGRRGSESGRGAASHRAGRRVPGRRADGT